MTQHVGRIFCCQPTYGHGDPAAVRVFWFAPIRHGSDYGSKLTLVNCGGSLLALGFNQAWAWAINCQEVYEEGRAAQKVGKGLGCNPFDQSQDGGLYHWYWELGWKDQSSGSRDNAITHLFMLHDDVQPDDGPIDTLMEDLLAHDADVVSAVCPIKTVQGLTSTAIDDPTNPFEVERRLTVAELDALPDVFSAADCGYSDRALLVNTGCWVCRFDRPWRLPPFAFTIRDQIVRNARTGRWQAEAVPEDWHLSKWVHNHGGKVLASKRVKVNHWGRAAYTTSRTDWGSLKVDEGLRHKFGDKPIGRKKP